MLTLQYQTGERNAGTYNDLQKVCILCDHVNNILSQKLYCPIYMVLDYHISLILSML